MQKILKRYPIFIDGRKELYTTIIELPKNSTLISILEGDVSRRGITMSNSYIRFNISVLQPVENSKEMVKYKLLIIKDSKSFTAIDDKYIFLNSSLNHYYNGYDFVFYHYDVFYQKL